MVAFPFIIAGSSPTTSLRGLSLLYTLATVVLLLPSSALLALARNSTSSSSSSTTAAARDSCRASSCNVTSSDADFRTTVDIYIAACPLQLVQSLEFDFPDYEISDFAATPDARSGVRVSWTVHGGMSHEVVSNILLEESFESPLDNACGESLS